MKHFIAVMIAICVVLLTAHPIDAKKHSTIPLPPGKPWSNFAQATNPDPFNTQRVGQTQSTQIPSPTVTPQPTPVVVTMPAPVAAPVDTGWQGWIHTALLAMLTAIGGKLAFKLPAMPSGSGPPKLDGKLGEIVTHLPAASIISDPNIRATIDATALRLVESGAPGEAIKMAFSFVPGAGPIVTMLEPAFRAISVKFLQDRAPGAATPIDPAAVHAETDQRLAGIEGILKLLVNRLTDKPAPPVA